MALRILLLSLFLITPAAQYLLDAVLFICSTLIGLIFHASIKFWDLGEYLYAMGKVALTTEAHVAFNFSIISNEFFVIATPYTVGIFVTPIVMALLLVLSLRLKLAFVQWQYGKDERKIAVVLYQLAALLITINLWVSLIYGVVGSTVWMLADYSTSREALTLFLFTVLMMILLSAVKLKSRKRPALDNPKPEGSE